MDTSQRNATPEQPSDVSAASWSGLQGQDAVGAGTGAPAAEQARAVGNAQGTVGAGAPGFDPGLGETPGGSGRAGAESDSSASGAESASTGAEATAEASATDEPPRERGRDFAEQLKPVATAAEEVTAKAVDLSAKGLTKLAAFLEKRRQARQARGRPDRDA